MVPDLKNRISTGSRGHARCLVAMVAGVALAASISQAKAYDASPAGAPSSEPPERQESSDSAASAATGGDDYASLLDRLGNARAVESGGDEWCHSPMVATAALLFAKATPEQRRSLLHHENPVVRVYAAYHTLDDSLGEAPSIEPLLRDTTHVMRIESCIGQSTSVSSLVLEAICWRSKEPVARQLLQVLLQVARAHHHPASGGALACVAESLPDKVTLLARKQLHDSDPKLVAKAIEALGNAGVTAAAGEVAALASHPDSGVRARVAKTLGKLGAPVGVRALARLARDPVDFVRRAAGEAYVVQSNIDPAVVVDLLEDEVPLVSTMVAAALAPHITPKTLPIIAAYLKMAPYANHRAVPDVPKNAAAKGTVALLRALAANSANLDVQEKAIRSLTVAGEKVDPGVLLEAIKESYDVMLQQTAAKALGDQGDVAYAPALEAMLKEDNPHARIAAAKALVKLHASRSRAALNAAAAGDTSWAGPEMRELAAELAQLKDTAPHPIETKQGESGKPAKPSRASKGVPRDEKRAAEFYEKACDASEMFACAKLGSMYREGKGVAKDVRRALELYQRACDGGEILSCSNLGTMYEEGLEVPKDEKRAVEHYEKACDGCEMSACARLGWMYDYGKGVPKYKKRAEGLYQKACDGGVMLVCSNLGAMFAAGEGVAKDEKRAVELYQKACNGGGMLGCCDLGTMYEDGKVVPKDKKRAVELFEMTCHMGEMMGCSNLGRMHEEGKGVAKDKKRAVELYQKACDGDEMVGCSNLGRMHEEGKGVPEDKKRAVDFYQKACDGGEMTACSNLGRMYEEGKGVAKDEKRAVELFGKACDGDVMRGCAYLGAMYRDGEGGLSRNRDRARQLYRMACDGGDEWGCRQQRRTRAEDAE